MNDLCRSRAHASIVELAMDLDDSARHGKLGPEAKKSSLTKLFRTFRG